MITLKDLMITYNRTSETMELTSNTVSKSKLENSLPLLTERHKELKRHSNTTNTVRLQGILLILLSKYYCFYVLINYRVLHVYTEYLNR